MIKNKASWVALSVLAIATALMVFVVQPNLNDETTEEAAQSTAGGVSGEPALATAETAPANGAQVAASDADAAKDWTVPGFDVLRVEPDGSTVIAGRAEPGTKLEILSGDTVLGTADVSAGGDFAAVFDKPLPAGDHQLTLRSVGAGGASRTSDEVATISVPKEPGGQLLAMVSRPGEASRLITTPKAEDEPAQSAAAPVAQADTAAAPATPDTPNAVPGLQVTAVEIEGKTMFVAGNARPGALVRIYADDSLFGEMRADGKGQFVVDGTIDLAVGSHIIRADMMNDDATKVAMRASVPFDRPEGVQVAAIAATPADAAATGLDGLKTEAGKALALLKGLFADGKQPTAEQLAAARSATEFALQSLAEFKPADNSAPAVVAAANDASNAAGKALSVLKSSPQDPASVVAALDKVDGVIGPALPRPASVAVALASDKPVMATQPETMSAVEQPKVEEAEETAAKSDIETKQMAAAAPATADEQPATIQQAPLQESKSSVIIRRGDTLWEISRRVYGAGVRYTTIYLANREQIENPDLIQPGQVFGVPHEALSDVESREIHRKHMRHED
ncbi:LysM peptidoglycan-binding domain-containing protein [Sinorhizobium alkalisoli]|uniref:Peptidoglycan-binding protein LysM n=1 Tax=Sinorhizobium alkalisoli TaxID=1752398 RepID=A0A1E3V6C8_9HYPH|nr:LysM peptidoglycan-binding domain-containing protein [Sinorhizobium alkalisoli]MCG5478019.1 LysM peptidoglycan-binding domain-containing protein [Sinorhizobium alkalisoli]ODR89183.1 peptidoglycan-binding protein LysM [Sinorhizobium alkalisoli]QFI65630.1 LysM domain protein [Sinorhizobium alkalisoli]